MPPPEATPWGTGTGGTYYFFDEAIAAYGRAYAGGVFQGSVGTTPLKVIPAPGGGMNVRVLTGIFRQAGVPAVWLAGDIALTAADPTYPRIDYVSVWLDTIDDTTAHLQVTVGIPDNSMPMPTVPIPSSRADGSPNIVLAMVAIHPGMTAVLEEHIYDRRFFLPFLFTGTANKVATAILETSGPDATAGGNLVIWGASRDVINSGRPLGTVGDLSGPAASVDGEVALYDGVTGKLLKRGTGTGPARLTSGVLGTGATALASEVTGDLPLANVAPATAASRLLLRGAAAGAGDWEEGTLGAGLSLTGTVLSSSGGSGLTPYAQLQNFSYNTDSTERTIWSFTVTANDLATARGLWLMLRGNLLCNSGSPTATPRIKYGATTLWGDVSPANTANANRKAWWLNAMLSNAGATNAQRLSGDLGVGAVTVGSVAGVGDFAAIGTGLAAGGAFTGSAAIDSTANQTFTITWQWSVSNVAVELVIDQAVAFLLT